jgi:sensor histidine kinase YesM
MKNNTKKRFYIMAIILVIVLSILENLPVINYQINGGSYKSERFNMSIFRAWDYLIIYTLTLISNASAFIICYIFIAPFNNKKSVVWKMRIMPLITLVIVFLFYYPVFTYVDAASQGQFCIFNFFRSLIISFMAVAFTVSIRSTFSQQLTELENERLKKENLQAQFESLRNDLSPHFLFNSLNALQTLIREDPEIANQYVNHLSNVLRSSLQSNDNQYVSLDDELKLVRSYIFLLEMRYGSNLEISIAIPEKYTEYKIPPLTIQTLIENAVKHNEISTRKPLKVRISIENNTLIVENNIQIKLTPEVSMGVGLSNLSKRFELLCEKEIVIYKTNNHFQVNVPLIS